MTRIKRNGQWVEVETGKAARKEVQEERKAAKEFEIQRLEKELEELREASNRLWSNSVAPIMGRFIENRLRIVYNRLQELKSA